MFVFVVCCVVLCVGLSKGSNGFPRGALRMNVGGSTAISDVDTRMKTRGVHSRKAYLWEFKYLVCIYLWKHQWATKKPEAS